MSTKVLKYIQGQLGRPHRRHDLVDLGAVERMEARRRHMVALVEVNRAADVLELAMKEEREAIEELVALRLRVAAQEGKEE